MRSAQAIRGQVQAGDYLIAADGGQRHLQTLGLKPDLLIGDLDSLIEEEVGKLHNTGVEVIRFAREKDETDLELAVREAIQRGFHDLLIVAALGGRTDQTLGNLYLLLHPQLADCQVRLEDGCEEVWLVRSALTIHGQASERVSLLAVGGTVHGIRIEGLLYPLQNENLEVYQTRGISNIMTGNVASVTVSSGQLLCIHTRKPSVGNCQE